MSQAAELLVHLCTDLDWENAQATPEWRPESLSVVGFVHLSAQCQVHLPANRLFAGRDDLVVLYLEQGRLGAVVRWEPGASTDPESMLFPHLYGPLPIAAVVDARPYIPGPDGRFAPLIHRPPR